MLQKRAPKDCLDTNNAICAAVYPNKALGIGPNAEGCKFSWALADFIAKLSLPMVAPILVLYITQI